MNNIELNKVQNMEFLLRKICFNLKKKGRTILEDFDITPPQFDALQYLVNEGELTISELSTRLFLAPSTITDLVDRMERSTLVERVRSTTDRRSVKVKVLDKGYQLIDKVVGLRCELLENVIRDISEDATDEFILYLKLLNDSALCL